MPSLGLALLCCLAGGGSLGCSDSTSEDATPSLEPMALHRACIKATACDVNAFPRVSDCIHTYEDFEAKAGRSSLWDSIYRCVLEAKSCKEVSVCYGLGDDAPCDQSYKASCEGGKASTCDLLDNRRYTFDCSGANLSCEIDPAFPHAAACLPVPGASNPAPAFSASVDCASGFCVQESEPCVEGDPMDRCQEAQLQSCLKGRWITINCAKKGLAPCKEEQPQGWARCGPPL